MVCCEGEGAHELVALSGAVAPEVWHQNRRQGIEGERRRSSGEIG